MVTNRRLIVIGLCIALSGCVLGSGPCLWLKPVRVTLSGHVHFRDFPGPDGIDNVPLLVLDEQRYVYAPAQSHLCLAANDLQLVGVAEFPQSIGENSHVSVVGTLFEAVSSRQYTRFLINVVSIVPLRAAR
ncbi:MAG TPA: hypothetical protein VNV13_03015 [Steroidobacteraceae bacterium]|nr:hypothetical protein [Steroidobacteraceae bacterium]